MAPTASGEVRLEYQETAVRERVSAAVNVAASCLIFGGHPDGALGGPAQDEKRQSLYGTGSDHGHCPDCPRGDGCTGYGTRCR